MERISPPGLGLLDSRYVNITGDTMSGNLTIARGNDDNSILYLNTYSTNANRYSRLHFQKSDSNTIGTLTETDTGDYLGNLKYFGVNDANLFAGGAYMSVQQTDDSGDYVPTEMEWVTYSATGPNLRQFVMSSDGSVYIGTGYDFGIGTTKWNSGDDIEASVLAGTIPADVLQTEWDAAYSHISATGASHSYIDQSVVSGSSPTFDGTNFTGIPDGALDLDYVEVAGDTMTGPLLLRPSADAVDILEVQQSDGTPLFQVNTDARTVTIGDEPSPNPGRRLHVRSSDRAEVFMLENTNDDYYVAMVWHNDVQDWSAGMWQGGSAYTGYAGANAFEIYQGLDAPMTFYTNDLERVRILGNGDVGIGTETPNEQLELTKNLRLVKTIATAGIIYSGADLLMHTFGTSNIFLGVGAGNLSLTGRDNVGIGLTSLQSLTSGIRNVTLGSGAGNLIQDGERNFALGYNSLGTLVSGDDNVAIGSETMTLATGSSNTALGSFSCTKLAGGIRNVAIGQRTLGNNTSGSHNVAIGFNAGNGTLSGRTGNIIIGYKVGQVMTTANYNVAIGYQAGVAITSGASNVFLGPNAGDKQTTASRLFIVDYLTRANIATELTDSILYGVMAATPAAQTLSINALLTTTQGRLISTNRRTTTYTALVTDDAIYCDTDGGAFTLTLPAGVNGQRFFITNCGTSGNDLTIDGSGGEAINGDATILVTDEDSVILIFETTEEWNIF